MLEAAGSWTRPAKLRALVVPHAGLHFSGPTAAHGYVCVKPNSFDRVVVLAPNHRAPLLGAVVDPSTHYETPLGRMPVDVEAVESLASRNCFACGTRPFALEHAIEMQLPFLQLRLPKARLVPIIIGDLAGDEFDDVASSLSTLVDDRTLYVISSDFMHYGEAFGYSPFHDHIAESIRNLDSQAIDAITRCSFDEFQAILEHTGNTVCGRRPLGVFLLLAPRSWRGELRSYTTSAEITGDYRHSVSYACLAFFEADDEPEALAEEAEEMLKQENRASSMNG
jgi:AmmeMemoRadiSam system protein B